MSIFSGVGFSMNRVINRSLTEAAIWERQSPRPSAAFNVLSRSATETEQCEPDPTGEHGGGEQMSKSMSSFTVHLPEIKSPA